MNTKTEFLLKNAPPEVQQWIRNVHRGIEEYFPLPEKTSLHRVRLIARWKAYDAARRPLEDRWGKVFAPTFERAGREAAQAYELGQSITRAMDAADAVLMPFLEKQLALLYSQVGTVFLRRLPESIQETKANGFETIQPEDLPELREYYSRTVATKVKQISESTRRYLSDLALRANREGLSITDVVSEIQASTGFSRQRAFLIARTEVIGSSNAATHFGTGRFFNSSQGVTKDWLSTGDRRTRPTHRRAGADQKNVPYDQPFTVGGALLMFPGDSSLGAPGKEVIQCRCTSLYNVPRATQEPTRRTRTPRATTTTTTTTRTPKPTKPKKPSSKKPKPFTEEDAEDLRKKLLEKMDTPEARELRLHWQRYKEDTDKMLRAGDQASREYYASSRAIWEKELRRLGVTNLTKDPTSVAQRETFDLLTGKDRKPGNLKMSFKGTKPISAMNAKAKDSVELINQLIGENPDFEGLEIVFHISGKHKRASALPWDNTININNKTDLGTILHEIGHVLEYRSQSLRSATTQFLDRRTEGKGSATLRELTGNPNYRKEEVARRDEFFDVYIGKDYRLRNTPIDRITEVASMGVEYLWRDPLKMAQADPEMFRMIVTSFRRQ